MLYVEMHVFKMGENIILKEMHRRNLKLSNLVVHLHWEFSHKVRFKGVVYEPF